MTRKDRILDISTDIVAQEGPEALSSKRIAKQALVSEALIFKHYGSLNALLDQVMNACKIEFTKQLELLPSENGKEFLKQCMEWPLIMPDKELWPWACFYRVKWSGISLDKNPLERFQERIKQSFESIGLQHSEQETTLTMGYIHGFFFNRLQSDLDNTDELLAILRSRYS